MSTTKRTFTLLTSKNEQVGRYKATTPLAAAKKAARRLLSKPSTRMTHFTIREITRGSSRSEFDYSGRLVKLKKPVTIHRKGSDPVVYKYKTEVKQHK